MVSLLRSGSVKTRFTALLTLGLSAVVYSAQPPALHAGVAPVYVVLQTYADRTQPIAPGVLSEASPSSIKGMLFSYQQARLALERSVAQQDAAYRAYLGLSGLTDAQVARFFPSGVYPKILEGSLQRYNTHQSQAEIDLITTNTALNRLSSGVILGHDEMLKLHIILGL